MYGSNEYTVLPIGSIEKFIGSIESEKRGVIKKAYKNKCHVCLLKKFNEKFNYTASVLNCGIDSFANSNTPNRIPTYIKSPTIAFCKKGSPAV